MGRPPVTLWISTLNGCRSKLQMPHGCNLGKPSEISARILMRHFGRRCGIWRSAYCAMHTL